MTDGLRAIDNEGRGGRVGHRIHRLRGPYFVVGGLQRRRGDIGAVGGCDEGVDADSPDAVDADRHRVPTRILVRLDRLQDGRVLDGAVHHGRRPPVAGQCAQNRCMQRLGAGRGEADLVCASAERRSHRLPRGVEQRSRATARAVQTRRISPTVIERGQQRLTGHRVQRRPGRGVEISCVARHDTKPSPTRHEREPRSLARVVVQ